MAMKEITFQGNPDHLRLIAKFLQECAAHIESNSGDFDHDHISFNNPDWGDDFPEIVVAEDENQMNDIINWIGLIAIAIGFTCFGIIGFKRSAWWGPSKSIMANLDSTEMTFMKIGIISLAVGILFFLFAGV